MIKKGLFIKDPQRGRVGEVSEDAETARRATASGRIRLEGGTLRRIREGKIDKERTPDRDPWFEERPAEKKEAVQYCLNPDS